MSVNGGSTVCLFGILLIASNFKLAIRNQKNLAFKTLPTVCGMNCACMCAGYYMYCSVLLNSIVELLNRCKAHLVRLTAKVQISPILLPGID